MHFISLKPIAVQHIGNLLSVCDLYIQHCSIDNKLGKNGQRCVLVDWQHRVEPIRCIYTPSHNDNPYIYNRFKHNRGQ